MNGSEPLPESPSYTELRSLVDIPGPQVRRAEVWEALAEALSDERANLKARNAARFGGPQFAASTAKRVVSLVRALDACGYWLTARLGRPGDQPGGAPELCAYLLLRRAVTTADAIALLIAHGYGTDAFARWRALDELAATSVLLARHRESELAERYLAQVDMLPTSATPPTDPVDSGDYDWLRPLYPPRQDKSPRRLSQTALFQAADLAVEDYPQYLRAANEAVHLSNRTLAEVRWDEGPLPLGFSAELLDDVADLTCLSLYWTISGCLLLVCWDTSRLGDEEVAQAGVWLDSIYHQLTESLT